MRRIVLLGIIFIIIIISTIFYIVEVSKPAYFDKEKIAQKVLSFQKPNGGFSVSISEDASLDATVISVATLYTLNVQDKLDKLAVVNFIRQCKGSDYGYKNRIDDEFTSIYATNQAIITLYLLGYEMEINKSEVINYIEKYNMSFYKLFILCLIDKERIDENEAINFIMDNYEEDHFKAGEEFFLTDDEIRSTFASLSMLYLFDSIDRVDKEKIHNYLNDKLTIDLIATYYNVGSLKIIGKFSPEYKEKIIKFVINKTRDGIFVEPDDGLLTQFLGSVIYMNIDNPPDRYLPWSSLYY